MSTALISLIALSALLALGMAAYSLRVLVGRWDQPRRRPVARIAPPVRPSAPLVRPSAPPSGWLVLPTPRPAAAPPPAPLEIPAATPPPVFTQPSHEWARPARPSTARLARGSLPPDPPPGLHDLDQDEVDTDDLEIEPTPLPARPRSRPLIQRGARFSVIRSSRR